MTDGLTVPGKRRRFDNKPSINHKQRQIITHTKSDIINYPKSIGTTTTIGESKLLPEPSHSRDESSSVKKRNIHNITSSEPISTKDKIDSTEPIITGDITDNQKVKLMEQSAKFLGKCHDDRFNLTNIKSRDSWLIHTIKRVITSTDRIVNPTGYKFVNSISAAKYNSDILERHQYDFSKAMSNEKNTTLDIGSEFRTHDEIQPLFQHHEYWIKIKDIITKGVTYNITPLTETERSSDLDWMIDRGNHKSAQIAENQPTLIKNYEKEVRYGWMLPVSITCVRKIMGAGVIPLGCAKQFTIDDKGKRTTKRRSTHDASFAPPSGKSINKQMDKDTLTECFYGHCLLRILHGIHVIRLQNPITQVFITKLDLDAAYRRLHVLASMAVKTITIIGKIAYILMRLPFGVTNGPSDFSLISEPLMDLTNDLLRDTTWDTNITHSPVHKHFQESSTKHTNTTKFGKARKLFVTVPYHPAIADGYIDDIITIMLGTKEWLAKGMHAAPLAVFAMFRPNSPTEPLPRDDPACIRKLKGEGAPDETKTVLGWIIDTRLFRIFLSHDKAKQWRIDLRAILKRERVNAKTMETVIGRLNHAAYLIPQSRYFLNKLRRLLSRCQKYGPQQPNREERADIHLWHHILDIVSSKGVDINNITFTEPTETTFSDACEHGLGGYTNSGLAWRYEIPSEFWGKLTINLLEFLAAAITINLSIDTTDEPQKVLAFTDSSSALDWLHKASFSNNKPIHDKVARWLGRILIDNDSSLYSQHIKGNTM